MQQRFCQQFERHGSSRPEVLCKKGAPINFAKLTRRHLRQSLLFNKVAGPRPATLLKKRPWHRCFLVFFVKFLRPPFFKEHLWWLLWQIFSKLVVQLQKVFLHLIIVSYFKDMPNSIGFCKGSFSQIIPVCIMVSWGRRLLTLLQYL